MGGVGSERRGSQPTLEVGNRGSGVQEWPIRGHFHPGGGPLHVVVLWCGGNCGITPVAVLPGGYPHLGCGSPSRADPREAAAAGSVPQGWALPVGGIGRVWPEVRSRWQRQCCRPWGEHLSLHSGTLQGRQRAHPGRESCGVRHQEGLLLLPSGSRLWSVAGQVLFTNFLLPLKKILETIVRPSCFFIAQEVQLRERGKCFSW